MTQLPPEQLTDFDSLMVRFDAEPRMRAHATALMLLDQPPDWQRCVASFDAASRRVPRLRQHVVEPVLRQFLPSWVVDPNFDLSYHVRRIALPRPGSTSQLLQLAAQLAMPPMDPSRPRWEVTVVDGLDDGSAALLFKSHHAMWDGLGFVSFLDDLLDVDPEAAARPLGPAPESPAVSPLGLTLGELSRDVMHGAQLPPRALGALATQIVRGRGNPLGAASAGAKQAGDLVRMLLQNRGRSPVLRARNLTWQFVALEVPLQSFRAAAHAAGGTLNDVFMAGVADGFRRYHDKLGVQHNRLTMGMAVSIRRDDDPSLGNRFAAGLLAVPLDIRDPLARVQWVHGAALAQRAAPYKILSAAAPVMNRWLPPPLVAPLLARQVTSVDVATSNVPGPRGRRYIGGAEVTRIFPFGPASGYPVQAALLSHADTCCIGLNCNGAAVTQIDMFGDCVKTGIDEVVAIGGDSNATTLLATSR